ncbi:MAG: hypothetical protein KTR32_39055 [Granulosicoccus sp.]|nr:hypothetical protein [Granulosicoccus sp.]
MGTNQPFRTSASWDQAIKMLDSLFPLTHGSHGSVKGYWMHFDHLVMVQTDGSTTSLKKPSQFIEAGGNWAAPTSILLEHDGMQVEIEPSTASASVSGICAGHRMQLLTTFPSEMVECSLSD